MATSSEQVVAALRKSLADNERLRQENAELRRANDDPIVIVGMGCRYPGGVANPDGLWDLLMRGGDAIGPLPEDRGWDPRLVREHPGGGFLSDAAGFDAAFFGISPREALAMDPQQRLLLEVVWEALEDAGIDPLSLRDTRTGVFIGASNHEYAATLVHLTEDVTGHVMTGNTLSVVAGRVAYSLGLLGPVVTVDTACSSSLVALHQAVSAVRSGECGRAVVGGVAVMSSPGAFVEFSRVGGLSSDGRCRAFADDAGGTGWSEGCGVVVVERLSAARARGGRVLAVVAGTAVGSDGASNGLTAPSGPAQERVISDALAAAGLTPGQVDVVEAHGTGTALGDPIEAGALARVFGAASRDRSLLVGSVKSNIGHSQAAAGMAGVIKMVLALRRGWVPATLHVDVPSRHVNWDATVLELVAEGRAWPESGGVRCAGVSAFGISGTNAHVLLQQPPKAPAAPNDSDDLDPEQPLPWLVSARDPHALAALAGRLGALAERTELRDADISAALAHRRAALSHRAVLLPGTDRAPALAALAAGTETPDVVTGFVRRGGTALVLPGQGSQSLGMGRGLADRFPDFARAFDEACAALDPLLGQPLRDIVWGDEERLTDTRWAQPALFAYQIAAARLLESWGLVPDVLIGHSVGEIAAAHLSGALELADAARLVAARALAMADLPGRGAMAALSGDPDTLAALAERLPDGVAVAARNSSSSIVLSGDTAALDAVLATAGAAVRISRLRTSHAFHSPLMAPAAAPLAAAVADLRWSPPRLPVVSTVTGHEIEPDTWAEPGYWSTQLTATVRFAEAVSEAIGEFGAGRVLELGAHPSLIGHIATDHPDTAAAALGHRDLDPWLAAHRAAAAAWCAGADLPRWIAPGRAPGPHVDLPTYPFTHQRFWPPIPVPADDTDDAALYAVEWREIADAVAAAEPEPVHWISVEPGIPVAETATRALAALQDALTEDDTTLRVVVTHGAVAAAPGDRPDPAQAAVRGLALAALAETPDRFRLLDLPVGSTPEDAAPHHRPTSDEPDVAVRDDQRRGPRWAAIESADTIDSAPIGDGPVLITGGTGGVGAAVARHLIASGATHLVLLSRRGPDAPGAAELRADLAESGATIDIVACDAADPAAFAAVLADLPAPPSLVVHAAGVLDDGLLANQTPERLLATLRAKIDAIAALDAAVADDTEIVVFSSVAGVLGSAGQSTYVAANAALDAWATARRLEGARRRTIAWGPWALGAGMADGADAATERRRESGGLTGLSAESALALFDAARRRPEPMVVATAVRRDRLAALGPALPAAWRDLVPSAAREPVADNAPEPASWSRLANLPRREQLNAVLDLVRTSAATVLGHRGPDAAAAIGAEHEFRSLGFDSLTSVELRNRLAAATGQRLSPTLAFDYPTPRRLADHLTNLLGGHTNTLVPEVSRRQPVDDDPIVIVGLGCRFPGGAENPDGFWELLVQGRDAIGPLPDDRGWDPEVVAAGPGGGFLSDAAGFDAGFFGISPREALAMDPQQRLLLEVVWEALEDAGIDPLSLRDSRTGVFVGTNGQDYVGALIGSGVDVGGHLGTGNAASVLSGRIAYFLGLSGPVVTVDTACSSSLVALHQAVGAVQGGECSRAVVGGVTVMSGPGAFMEFSRVGGLSPDGRCRAFAEGEGGTGWSEGCGVVVVERLSAARERGGRVLAVVGGSAVGSDGASNGLTAPSGPAQERVIAQALATAGLGPADVDVLEAHGTGTALGDPIEAGALERVFGAEPRDRSLLLGSVKSNIGHTQGAAGMAGLIKMVLAMEHGWVPATLHVQEPSRFVDWDQSVLELVDQGRSWPTGPSGVRRAGISSFGISGTNAHVVLLQAPQPAPDERPTPAGDDLPLVLSAATPTALARAADRIARHIDPESTPPHALSATLARRARLPHRAAIVTGTDTAAAALAALARGDQHPALITGVARPGGTGILFPGQGTQRLGMGRELAAADPTFAAAFDEACAALDAFLDRPLREVCWGDEATLTDTRWAQPALFAYQIAAYRLLEARGLEPAVLLGHSVGEITAAHAAGALGLADAARLVVARGRLMSETTADGSMAAVSGRPDALAELAADLPAGVVVAARNSSTSIVLSGDTAALDAVLTGLDAELRVSRLHTSHAFHSPLMAPAADALAAVAGELRWSAPHTPVASTVTGRMLEPGAWADPAHWATQLTEPVLFADAVTAAAKSTGLARWIELGVHPSLVGHVRTDHDTRAHCLGHRDEPPAATLRRALAQLWCDGAEFAAWPATAGPHLTLPTYPFEHQRFWPPVTTGLTYLREEWTPLGLAAGTPSGRWLLHTDGTIDAALAALRDALAADVTATDEDLRAALTDDIPPAGVLAVVDTVNAVPDLVRVLAAAQQTGAETRLWCLTRGAVEPGAAQPDSATPEAAAVWGLGRSAALEHPGLWGGLLDLPPNTDDAQRDARAVAAALAAGGEDQIAVRDGQAHARRLAAMPRTVGAESWQPSGTVLITGGTGALGGRIAVWSAEHGADRIVLAGRRGPDAPGADDLRTAIESRGATVHFAALDIADEAAVTALLADLDTGPAPTAVVHAAGVLDDAPLTALEPALLASTARPKAVGAAVLDAATRGRDMDFIVLTSVAGVWGSGGQGAYSAANAAADAIVRRRRRAGERAVAIAWGPWDGGGMASDPQARAALTRRGLRPIDPQRALDVLPTLARGPEPVVAVADLDLERFVATFTSLRPAALLADLAVPTRTRSGERTVADAGGADAPTPPWRAAWDRAEPTDRLDLVTGLVRTEVGEVLGHTRVTALDAATPLRDLGLDSLTSVDLRDRIRAATGLDLPTTLAFDHPSIGELAAEVHRELASAGTDAVLADVDRLAVRLRDHLPDEHREHLRLRLREILAGLEETDDEPDTPLGATSARERLAEADDEALFAFISEIRGG
ncbi:type I polyketide synthase [Nocardia terpenica]|uniref:Type I modular polyketide synthase n=1 Tax=Nocardia terpenica TaxID=455432 RepID=A0A0U1Z2G9_9NOCA|nr:type I polyketide synthase [Nocardia terpenica]AJO72743.1 Type I modular polyketide synthase [Nocardia terpenica]KZM75364.1 hypothetical protein AWN90_18410 [Nocardia terpenica]NQE85823.1 type I polyketide synthase [Nocardia terpenica]BBE00838.1 polyketide synthase [Nocardia terpenica]